MTHYQADAVVVGGGIVGCATAYQLTQSGMDVILLERAGIGSGATGRSGGGVRQSARVSGEIPLAIESVNLFQGLSDELGIDIDYTQSGNLRLVEMYDHRRPMQVDISRQQSHGLDVQWLEGADVIEIAPALRRQEIIGASYCPEDGHCDPFKLITGYFNRATQNGVRTLLNSDVHSIERNDDGGSTVKTQQHSVKAGSIILATGSGTQELCLKIGYDLPLVNARYESMITEPLPPLLRQMFGVASSDLFFRQTQNGGIHFGGGIIDEEEQEDVRTTQDNLEMAVSHITRLVSNLENANLLRTWGGLDPSTPDGMPIIDILDENVFVASGFCGHGLATGPIVGHYLAQWVIDGNKPQPLAGFNRNRFDGWLQTKWTPSGSFEAALATQDTQVAGKSVAVEGVPFMTPPDFEQCDDEGAPLRLMVSPEMCTGCRMCEVACSIHHTQSVSQTDLRIQVVYPSDDFFLPIMCIHCEPVFCLQACTHKAMEQDEQGIVRVIDNKCVGCMDCVKACPTGGVTFAISRATVVKCDLCDGDPACTRYCPTMAITYRQADPACATKYEQLIDVHLKDRVTR